MMKNIRSLLSVILKILSYLGIVVLLFVFFNSLFVGDSRNAKNKDAINEFQAVINLESLQKGKIRKIRWNGKEVAVLYRESAVEKTGRSVKIENLHDSLNGEARSQKSDYFVFINTGDSNNCPLFYRSRQFTDTCTSSKYDDTGRAINHSAMDLAIPPHYFKNKQLIIGRWEAKS